MSLKVAVIGAGARGQIAYGQYCLDNSNEIMYVAAVDPNVNQLEKIKKSHKIDQSMLFTNEEEFYAMGKICDAVVVANMDKDHYKTVMSCIDLGYDILLEKPITTSREELEAIKRKVEESEVKVIVCYVLRYTPFFKTLKDIVDSGRIGRLIGIDHTEYIGNYHMAHSFVRGNWRNTLESSPIILQKTSHDLDILTWLIDSEYEEVYSSGKLNYFNEDNAPVGATKKCLNCPHKDSCKYNAQHFYIDPLPAGWANHISANPDKETVEKVLETTNYGSCVYQIKDNDVCDHQVSLIKFKNGVDVTFTLTAFHHYQSRFTRLFGTKGSIIADGHSNTIKIIDHEMFEDGEQCITEILPEKILSGHGGGDLLIMKDFVKLLTMDNYAPRTSLQHALQSHYMAFDLEESRINNSVISNKINHNTLKEIM